MTKPEKNPKQKRPYRKPGLRIVKLAAKEVLATGCKMDSDISSGPTPIGQPCGPGTCVTIGS